MLQGGRCMASFPRILLIDGNHEDRNYYAHRLQMSLPDCVVVQAVTGRVGLECCKHNSIDCVVLELDLPDMSGFEVLLKLVPRVQQPEIAVILLTRLSNPYLLEAAVSNGAQAALHKSMTSGDILDKTVLKAIATVQKDKRAVRI
jgi:DNA-binding NarL/FixJ family response regulator